MDVAIIGVGLHPFGRFDDKTGYDMGLYATRQALGDAGIEWKDIQCAFGGSMGAGTADSLLRELGPTSIQFTNIFNGCATAGASVSCASLAIESGRCDLALAVGFDKHPRGMFAADPALLNLPSWFGETGLCITTQFFAMKIKRYMHEYGITDDSLIRVAVKNYLNGSITPHAWR
ncbi:MAG: thiolase family protein, partial [Deltaproteobacteria bacterium]|nr:thiolase family protein [Deltaproteobacteria bacterium]